MSLKTVCDISKKEFKKQPGVRVYSNLIDGFMLDYCKSCWTDKKNWSKIHKVKTKKQN